MAQTPFKKVLELLGNVSAAATNSGSEANALLKSSLTDLNDLLGAFRTAAGQSADNARATLQSHFDFEQGVQLEQFFNDVASSLIRAQAELDAASLEYSKAAAIQNLPPARYAIPNVKAQLRFGVSSVSSRGFNLVVFSDKKQKEEHSESSIEFDLVATSPEPKAAMLGGAPLTLVGGPRREAVLDKFLKLVPPAMGTQDKPAQRLQANRSIAAVFEYPATEPPRFLIIWPGRSTSANAAVTTWLFLAVAILQGDELLSKQFDKPAQLINNILYVPNNKDLESFPDSVKALVWNTGDALLQLCLICAGETT